MSSSPPFSLGLHGLGGTTSTDVEKGLSERVSLTTPTFLDRPVTVPVRQPTGPRLDTQTLTGLPTTPCGEA